ncbi:MAG: hypothetical protein LBS80_05280 [Tannerella sp.]|jgi:hypothetical protein|nr:hypothetical protein [Tannerella sp.]
MSYKGKEFFQQNKFFFKNIKFFDEIFQHKNAIYHHKNAVHKYRTPDIATVIRNLLKLLLLSSPVMA